MVFSQQLNMTILLLNTSAYCYVVQHCSLSAFAGSELEGKYATKYIRFSNQNCIAGKLFINFLLNVFLTKTGRINKTILSHNCYKQGIGLCFAQNFSVNKEIVTQNSNCLKKRNILINMSPIPGIEPGPARIKPAVLTTRL